MLNSEISSQTNHKIWLERYPADVPAEINPERYRSLIELFEHSVLRYGENTAYLNLGTALSFQDLDRQSRDFAACLQNTLKITPGDRVALMMPNCLQYPVALFGTLRAGAVVVNVNPLYTPRELKHQLQDSGARAIVLFSNFTSILEKVVSETPLEHIIVTQLGDAFTFPKSAVVDFTIRYLKKRLPAWKLPCHITWRQALKTGRSLLYQRPETGPEDIAFLQYTGGTTGVAKGTILTHRNMIANIEQIRAVYGGLLTDGEEKMVTALPLYHIFALTVNCLFFTEIGGCNLLVTNPYDITALAKSLKHYPFTVIAGVNTLFKSLLNNKTFCALDFSTLKLSVGGGMAIHPSVAEQWEKLTGDYILEGYGLTECSPLVSVNPYDINCHTGSIGLPVPSTDIQIISENGEPAAPGEPGELCIRGPQVMKGYWQQSEATREAIDAEGWLYTGDIITQDQQGFITIVDRKKDMILVSGFNVYPSEIENVLLEHEKVLEAAAVGIPSELTGEAVKVFIVAKDPQLSGEELIAWCRQFLTGYKVPKLFEFRESLPKSNIGKVLRRELN